MSTAEIFWDIPVLIENREGCGAPMDTGGFPFERRDRQDTDQSFRHQLDDIAQRHPELAEHLQGFPRRRSTEENDEFFRRRFERPFGRRFERFGFPLDRDDIANNYQQPQNSHQSDHSQQPPFSQQENHASEAQESSHNPTPPKVSQATQTEADFNSPSNLPESPIRGQPIQQSNTCDLTQKLEQDNLNDREQRSMSAPPDNKQRFVSSVHIPMGNKGPVNNEQQKTGTNSGSAERVIPIHVEGRDDPIIPKNFSTTSAAPQPERLFSDDSRAPPESIFGQRPEQFTQFVREPRFGGNDGWHHPVFERRHGFPEEEFMERSASPVFTSRQTTHQQQQPKAPQQSHVEHETEQTVPAQAQQQTPKPKQNQPLGPIEQIQSIQKDVSELLIKVEQFSGLPKDKTYLYLDEMLTRNLLKLDNVDTQGQDSIRSARKEAIRCIEKAISVLEAKAAANLPKDETMEVVTEEGHTAQSINAEGPPESSLAENGDTKSIEDSKSMDVNEVPEIQPSCTEENNVENKPQSQKSEEVKPVSSNQLHSEQGENNSTPPLTNVDTKEPEKEESADGKQKKKIKKKKDNC